MSKYPFIQIRRSGGLIKENLSFNDFLDSWGVEMAGLGGEIEANLKEAARVIGVGEVVFLIIYLIHSLLCRVVEFQFYYINELGRFHYEINASF